MKKFFRVVLCLVGVMIVGVLLLFFYNTKIVESGDPALLAPVTTKFVDNSSEKIAYREIDNHSETTVIFIGGLSAWSGTWERVIQAVNEKNKNYNYVALDLPPFGYGSPSVDKNYFRDTQAKRIAQFVESKKMNRVIVVAHSYGAGPGTEYVMNNESKVEKLIIIDGVLNVDEVKVVSESSLVHSGILREVLLGVLVHNDTFALSRLRAFVNIPDHVDQQLLDIYTRYFNTRETTKRLSDWFGDYVNDPLVYKSNFSENYRSLRIPVRLIWGSRDTVTPIDGTKILLDNIENIKLATLDGVGHIPMIEDYALFDGALLEALNK